jgi:hypothetical protein
LSFSLLFDLPNDQELSSIADSIETAFDKLDRLENDHNKYVILNM